jgi:hypothetical protein
MVIVFPSELFFYRESEIVANEEALCCLNPSQLTHAGPARSAGEELIADS